MRGPLDGIRVLDIGISTAGPLSARLLGDLGADVLKIEPLDGENTRSLGLRYGGTGYLFHANNYNKRSIALKLQHPRGRELFLALVAGADVVVENFAIGTMDKWGIGYDACRAANPSIVYCSVKGFGESGPMKDLRAFDTVTQALCGIMDTTGQPGGPPLKAGPSVCDLMGATVSALAMVAALVAREPGRGQFVDTALFDVGALALAPLWPHALAGDPLARLGNGHPDHAPFGDFACADGTLMLAVADDPAWRALAPLVGLPAEWTRAERVAQHARIDDAVAAWIAPQRVEDLAERLQALGVPAAPVRDVGAVAESAHVAARGMIAHVAHPAYGDVPLIATPLPAAIAPRTPRRLQPTLGEHNDEVLGGELGRADDLAALREQGVVR
jgi:CoA:oxalate CoA-transferase